MKKKVKVLFLHSGAELYGADQILLTTISKINRDEIDPLVVLPNDGPLVEKIKYSGVDVKIIHYPIIRRKYFNIIGIIRYVKELRKSIKTLTKLINENQVDIIHNNTIAVLEGPFLKKSGVKLVTHIHEMIDNPKIIAKILYSIHLNKCDQVVAVSNHVKEHIEKMFKKEFNNISVIHNGIEPIALKNKKKKYLKEFNIPENAKVVGIVGRINAIKGQDHFVKAMKEVIDNNDNVYGLIIGDAFLGQEWRIQYLKEKIIKYDLQNNIICTGFRSDVEHLYSAIDLLVLSSVQNDSFPTVVLEAMSCGIPTIAYRCGGVEEMIIDGDNGFLIEQGNVEALSDAINYILQNEQILNKFKNQSILRFNKEFKSDNYIKKITDIYLKW